MKYKHYSPDTRVLMVRDGDWSTAVQWAKNKKIRAGVIASPEIADQVRTDTAAVYMYNDDSVEAAAKGLFAGLRGLDESNTWIRFDFCTSVSRNWIGECLYESLEKSSRTKLF